VPSGFPDLDEMTTGFHPGDLVVVAARPSMGKTSFVLNIAQHVGTHTTMTVGFFSLEMSKEQLFMRMLTSEARIDAHRFRSGYLSEKDYGNLSHALGTLAEARVFIDDTASIGVLEMRAKSRRLKAEHGLDLVIIDYLQLMQGRAGSRAGSRKCRHLAIAQGLAKELACPIIALSQLSRAPEARTDHRPQLSDLRESGAIEQDADVVTFIYRPRSTTRKSEAGGAGHRRDHHRQAAQRPDRHGEAVVPQPVQRASKTSPTVRITDRCVDVRACQSGAWLPL
jgi:replicative DNA helicase